MAYVPEIWGGTAVLLPLGPSVLPARMIRWPQWTTPLGGAPTMIQVRWPQKAAGAVLDYGLDLTDLLAADGDTIASATAVASPGDIGFAVVATQPGATSVRAMLADGTALTDYLVTWTITTAVYRVHKPVVRVLVVPDSESDLYLTDGAGNVLSGPAGGLLTKE